MVKLFKHIDFAKKKQSLDILGLGEIISPVTLYR
jgi:hypothetical protein